MNDISDQENLLRERDNLKKILTTINAKYLEKIEEVKADREELMSNDELLEKFARENYLMKKPEEDVYVVVDEEKENDDE